MKFSIARRLPALLLLFSDVTPTCAQVNPAALVSILGGSCPESDECDDRLFGLFKTYKVANEDDDCEEKCTPFPAWTNAFSQYECISDTPCPCQKDGESCESSADCCKGAPCGGPDQDSRVCGTCSSEFGYPCGDSNGDTNGDDDCCDTIPSICLDEQCMNSVVYCEYYENGDLELPFNDDDRRLEIIQEHEGALDSRYYHKEGLLNPDQCDKIARHLDKSKAISKQVSPDLVAAAAGGDDEGMIDDYAVRFTPCELRGMIGIDGVNDLYNAFQGAKPGAPITRIIGRRSDFNGTQRIRYHHDEVSSVMIVNLNDDFKGGQTTYLNREGLFVVPTKQGAANLHGMDIVHGVTALDGIRYILILVSDTPDAPCVMKDLIACDAKNGNLLAADGIAWSGMNAAVGSEL